jgi:hypothetical protein
MNRVRARFLPTPERSHVCFNMHDAARVFQGLLHADVACFSNTEDMLVLWKHEMQRSLLDKLPSTDDYVAAWEVRSLTLSQRWPFRCFFVVTAVK